jgi:hypothetical protein
VVDEVMPSTAVDGAVAVTSLVGCGVVCRGWIVNVVESQLARLVAVCDD